MTRSYPAAAAPHPLRAPNDSILNAAERLAELASVDGAYANNLVGMEADGEPLVLRIEHPPVIEGAHARARWGRW